MRAGLAALPATLAWRANASWSEEFTAVPLPPEAALGDTAHPFWDSLQSEFAVGDETRHFNTAGLCIPPRSVFESMHTVALAAAADGDPARGQLDRARRAVARFIGADATEVALMRNATEAMNVVARGIELRRGDEIVLTTHEHPGGAAPWVALHQDAGVELRLVEPRSDPAADAAAVLAAMTKRTRVVVVSHVLSTLGTPMPVAQLAPEVRSRGAWFVVDGAQAAGIVPVDVRAIGADCYLASGHKWLMGPPETGFLHVRRERLGELRTRFAGVHTADAVGWDLDHGRLDFLPDASRYEYGTRSPAQAAGLAAGIEWLEFFGPDTVRQRALGLGRRFRAGLAGLPGVEVLTPDWAAAETPIVTFRVTRRPNTQVVDWLWSELRMRLRPVPDRGLNAVRASFHLVNRAPDVDWLIEAVRVLGA